MADALTADQVTSIQAFRDLFSDQLLRPGMKPAMKSRCRSDEPLMNCSGDFPSVELNPDGIAPGEPSPDGTIELANGTDHERTFIIEERASTR